MDQIHDSQRAARATILAARGMTMDRCSTERGSSRFNPRSRIRRVALLLCLELPFRVARIRCSHSH
eukprot:1411759-Alexandrium_andersonii.AAC.1